MATVIMLRREVFTLVFMNAIPRIACTFAIAIGSLSAQTLPSFEVASIRPVDRTGIPGHGSVATSGPRVTFTGYTVSALIQYAFDMRNYQISGGPGWIGSETYTVSAKAEGEAAPATAEVRKLLQSLLADRFELKVHKETKEAKVYLLEPARTGPVLKPSVAQRPTMQMGSGHLMMVKITPAQFAAVLSSVLGRPVLDKTGVIGEYDFTLDSPDISMGPMQPVDESSGPSIFTAVQEQLGLKLTPSKGPIDTVAIDHVSKPAAN